MVTVWLGLGTKMTWLGLEKDHCDQTSWLDPSIHSTSSLLRGLCRSAITQISPLLLSSSWEDSKTTSYNKSYNTNKSGWLEEEGDEFLPHTNQLPSGACSW